MTAVAVASFRCDAAASPEGEDRSRRRTSAWEAAPRCNRRIRSGLETETYRLNAGDPMRPPLTWPPNIVRAERNAFVRCKPRLVLKSVLEARRGRWVWPKVVRIETHRGTAGQKASSE